MIKKTKREGETRPEAGAGPFNLFDRLPYLGLACWGPAALEAVARHEKTKLVIMHPDLTRAWSIAMMN